jgi:hypothetical protein
MSEITLRQRRLGERGESNAKFIATLVVMVIIGYVVYSVLPVYYKEQQLKHDTKEEVRIGAVNGRDPKQVEKNIFKKMENIDFPEPIKIKSSKKGDSIIVTCTGTVPIDLVVYTYKYEINFTESFNRSGY